MNRELKRVWDGIVQGMSHADVPFLLFLISIVHVKLYIKLAAAICYAGYLLYKRSAFPKKITETPGWFYLLIIPIGVIGAFFNDAFSESVYWRGLGIATMKWLTAGVSFYLLVVTRRRLSTDRLVATIQAFFLINALVSAVDLAAAMVDSQRWMPYWINDRPQYGISTGDYIRGLSRDNSVANAALNLMGVLFFLFRRKSGWVLLCLVVSILCTSNFSMILLLLSLFITIVLIRDRRIKLYAGGCAITAISLYAFLSMQNVSYSNNTIQKEITSISSQNTPVSWRATHKRPADNPDADSVSTASGNVVYDLRRIQAHLEAENGGRLDTGTARHVINEWYGRRYDKSELAISGMPGKMFALMQAGSYMTSGVRPMLVGAGTGNFASNIAIKMTGLGIHGHYPSEYIYVHSDFLDYHLYIWLYVFAHTSEFQSVTQLPANVYSQLGGEYGLIGLCLFFGCYVFYFLKRNQFHVQALILTAVLLGYFFVDYWFEMISLTVFFELMMLTGPTNPGIIRTNKNSKHTEHE